MNEQICDQCGHKFGPHILMSPESEKCGVLICQEQDCDCFSTWGIEGITEDEDVVRDIAKIYGITDAASAREAIKSHGKPDLDPEYMRRLLGY